ncbi:MAG: polyprenyl synthetase family protein [Candidatus Eremiobacteraeota bacterium]|nr:polyprenyl synthetase family protein [Candidatus Eremiobacteraeota bacterium]
MIAKSSGPDLLELVENFFRTSFSTDNPLITQAVERMLAAGGKRLRPRLTLLAAEANGANAADQLPLAAYMELIHVATLIHDDVVDRASTRRGINATAVDYGNRVSVLAGDYLFAWIFKNVTAQYPAPIPHILSATLADICDGEVMQLRSLGNLELSVHQYVDVAMKKTASLFAACAECGATVAAASPLLIKALRDFGLYYGIAFQMKDDLLDMTAQAEALGKPVGNDLRERKVTIPLILALQDDDAQFRDLVTRFYAGDGETDPGGVIRNISQRGGFERTREHIAHYCQRAKMSLAPLGKARARARLHFLADTLTSD